MLVTHTDKVRTRVDNPYSRNGGAVNNLQYYCPLIHHGHGVLDILLLFHLHHTECSSHHGIVLMRGDGFFETLHGDVFHLERGFSGILLAHGGAKVPLQCLLRRGFGRIPTVRLVLLDQFGKGLSVRVKVPCRHFEDPFGREQGFFLLGGLSGPPSRHGLIRSVLPELLQLRHGLEDPGVRVVLQKLPSRFLPTVVIDIEFVTDGGLLQHEDPRHFLTKQSLELGRRDGLSHTLQLLDLLQELRVDVLDFQIQAFEDLDHFVGRNAVAGCFVIVRVVVVVNVGQRAASRGRCGGFVAFVFTARPGNEFVTEAGNEQRSRRQQDGRRRG
jgi:hypothetical protein